MVMDHRPAFDTAQISGMGRLGLWAAALFGILTLGIGGARWIAPRGAAEVFPLPDARGCWVGMCIADLSDNQIRAAIWAQPAVSQRRAYAAPDTYHLLVEAGRARPVAVTLYAPGEWYTLSWDWTVPDNPAIMRLGDLIAALGPPDVVRGSPNGIALRYTGRNLEAVVSPDRAGVGWALLQPHNPVRIVQLFPWGAGADSPAPGPAWRAFGVYRFGS